MSVITVVKAPAKQLIHSFDNYREERRIKGMYRGKNTAAHEFLKKTPMPDLSNAQKSEIDEYWAQFGIRIRDYCWFQWYYGVNGKIDPRFIPNDIYAYIVWPHYNNEPFADPCSNNNDFVLAWRDKNCFERFLPEVSFPNTLIHVVHGSFYDKDWNLLSCNENVLLEILKPYGQVLVKDALDTGEGRGVKKYNIRNKDDVCAILKSWNSNNYVIQEVIQQHEFFSQFNQSSVNLMRINSFRMGNEIFIYVPVLRFGMEGQVTDVCFINGEEIVRGVGITQDGYLKDTVFSLDGKKSPIKNYINNPNTRIPCWDEIINMIKISATKLRHFNLIGWDFTVSDNEKPICIEYNIQRPSTVFCQLINGPFFCDQTDEVLAFLRDSNLQKKLIPQWMRIQ